MYPNSEQIKYKLQKRARFSRGPAEIVREGDSP
jgi:hypothetical protein